VYAVEGTPLKFEPADAMLLALELGVSPCASA
jgi:hypothetical protein